MNSKDLKWTIGLTLLALVPACGSTDDGAGSGQFSSTLPKASVISSLSASESSKLCSEYNLGPLKKAALDVVCLQSALFAAAVGSKTDAEARATCSDTYAACIKTVVPDAQCPFGTTCQVTVAQFERCTNDIVTAYGDVGAALPSCTEVTVAALQKVNLKGEPAEPASCSVVDVKCPSSAADN